MVLSSLLLLHNYNGKSASDFYDIFHIFLEVSAVVEIFSLPFVKIPSPYTRVS